MRLMLAFIHIALFILSVFANNLFAPDTSYSVNSTLTSDLNLHSASRVLFNATLTLNGDGFTIHFPAYASTPTMVLNTSTTATITNCLLENFVDGQLTIPGGSTLVFGSGAKLSFDQSFTSTKTWYFGSNAEILGNGKVLTLNAGGVLRVQSGGSLKISNLTIVGASSNNIICTDNTSAITFENVKFVMTNNWTFSTGIMSILGNNTIAGPYTFAYASTANATISANSSLKFDRGTNFNFAPATGATPRTNLVFTDATSTLHLDGCTLTIPNTGMQVSKGTLEVSREVVVENTATSTQYDQGLVLGTGVYANDAWPVINPGANLKINSGMINYKNEQIFIPTPLLDGELITLRNTTYNNYVHATNQTNLASTPVVGKATATFPGCEWKLWLVVSGSSTLTSGLTNVIFIAGEASWALYPVLAALIGNSATAAPVSSPAPPYYNTTTANAPLATHWYYVINKIGGTIGDPIYPGDTVELYHEQLTPRQYLASAGLAYPAFSPDTEVFLYRSGTRPATGALWIIDRYIA